MNEIARAVSVALDATSGVRVVSFDVFDTLLLRRLHPKTVIALELRRLQHTLALHGLAIEPDFVAGHRARWHAAKAEHYRIGEAEWTVDEWAHALADDTDLEPGPVISAARSASFMSEVLATHARPGAAAALTALVSAGVDVVATSDTWMPEDLLTLLLAEKGVGVERVYASGTRGCSKRRGGIFEVVAEDLGVDADAILHVGDNWKGDWVRPRQAGWRSVWLHPPSKPQLETRVTALPAWATHRRAAADIARALHAEPEGDGLERIGHAHLAPLLCAFHLAQERVFDQAEVERVVYLARDAYLMVRVREILDPEGRPTTYLRLSRRAISLAHPADLLGSGSGIAGRFGKGRVDQFLGAFVLPEAWVADLLAAAGLEWESPLDLGSRAALMAALGARHDEIEALRRAQRALLGEFLRDAGVGEDTRIGLVDTGWAGTTQDAMRACVAPTCSLAGVYLGVSADGETPVPGSTKYGLLRDDHRSTPFANAWDRAAGVLRVWDTVFREPHASVRRLDRAADGRVGPVWDERTWPDTEQASLTAAVARGVEAGVRARAEGAAALAALEDDVPLAALEAYASSVSRRLVAHPTRDEARALLALRYEEADGGKRALGWSAVRDRTAWYPGIAAVLGLGIANRALDLAAEGVDALVGRNG